MHLLADLIEKLKDKEKKVLNNHVVEHPTLIGEMYEGLTKKILKEIDMPHPGIKVVSGIIRFKQEQSGQIDCMIVIGEGERIPNTDHFSYPIDQVIAVFEVKKNLFSREMGSAYSHLDKVFQQSKNDLKSKQDEGELNFDTVRPAEEFINLFGKTPPHYEDMGGLLWEQKVVYHSLVRDWLAPLRIVIGYNGFKSESALRSSVFKIYEGKELQEGYGVQNMPNLMISDGFSLVKMNGMPYKGIWDDDMGWCWIGSSNANPILLIMEILFDRIELLFKKQPYRGEDLSEEPLFPLIYSMPSLQGWTMTPMPSKVPKRDDIDTHWSPIKLSDLDVEFLKILNDNGSLHIDCEHIWRFKMRHKIEDLLECMEHILSNRVILFDHGHFSISHSRWSVAKVNGIYFCGDNAGKRFQNWVSKNTLPPLASGKDRKN